MCQNASCPSSCSSLSPSMQVQSPNPEMRPFKNAPSQPGSLVNRQTPAPSPFLHPGRAREYHPGAKSPLGQSSLPQPHLTRPSHQVGWRSPDPCASSPRDPPVSAPGAGRRMNARNLNIKGGRDPNRSGSPRTGFCRHTPLSSRSSRNDNFYSGSDSKQARAP